MEYSAFSKCFPSHFNQAYDNNDAQSKFLLRASLMIVFYLCSLWCMLTLVNLILGAGGRHRKTRKLTERHAIIFSSLSKLRNRKLLLKSTSQELVHSRTITKKCTWYGSHIGIWKALLHLNLIYIWIWILCATCIMQCACNEKYIIDQWLTDRSILIHL